MYYALGKSSVSEAISEFANLLNEKLDQEIERQMILIGPHRDDLQIF